MARGVRRKAWNFQPPAGSAIVPGHPLTNRLLGAWSFNEMGGTKAFDGTSRRSDGTLTNGPARTTRERLGRCITFDGVNDYVDVTNEPLFDITGAVTLSIWFLTTTNPGGATYVLVKEFDGIFGCYWLSVRPSNELGVGVRFGTGAGDATQPLYTDTAVTNGKWHHYAMTSDRITVRLYFDGMLRASLSVGGPTIPTSNAPVAIGRYGTTFGGYFTGTLALPLIYDRALSKQEILWLYAEPFAIFQAPSPRIHYFLPSVIFNTKLGVLANSKVSILLNTKLTLVGRN